MAGKERHVESLIPTKAERPNEGTETSFKFVALAGSSFNASTVKDLGWVIAGAIVLLAWLDLPPIFIQS